MNKKPVIILSCYTAGLGVIRALGLGGIPVVAIYNERRDLGRHSKFVGEKILSPHPLYQEKAYIDFLLNLARRFNGSLLVPTSDEALGVVSKYKELLRECFVVACPDADITKVFLEKQYTYELADKLGIPAPRTIIPRTLHDVEEYAYTVNYPCLLKPSVSHLYYVRLKKKMTMVNNVDELLHAYREVEELQYEMMLQEYIPGEDCQGANYNAYYWDGEPIREFTAHKIRNAPPVIGSPCALISEHIPEVIDSGRKILSEMHFCGYACTEFKKDPRDGIYKLMEVNARHNLSSMLAVKCGINFPLIQYKHLIDGEIPTTTYTYEKGIYWIDIARDLGYTLTNKNKKTAIKDLFRPYINPHVYADFDLDDPGPFLFRLFDVFAIGIRTVVKANPSYKGN